MASYSRSTSRSTGYSRATSRATTTAWGVSTSRTTSTLVAGPLQVSGEISLNDARSVLAITGAVSFNGIRGQGTPALPASGVISMTDLYGLKRYRNTTTTWTTTYSRSTTTSWTTSWTATTSWTTIWDCNCNCQCRD